MNLWPTDRYRHFIIFLLLLILFWLIYRLPVIAQDPSYHNFSDQKILFGITNFYNVVSNIPFIIIGLIGLYSLYIKQSLRILEDIKYQYALLFIGLCLLGPASGYYHLNPNNSGLFLDRLVMSVTILSLFSIIIAEQISSKLSRYFFIPLIITGISCVSYWYQTELSEAGDLRLYIAVQFIPIILSLVILLIYPCRFNRHDGYWWMFVIYLIAKLCEFFDTEIYQLSQFWISGHTLKHLLAALAVWMLVRLFYQRDRKKI